MKYAHEPEKTNAGLKTGEKSLQQMKTSIFTGVPYGMFLKVVRVEVNNQSPLRGFNFLFLDLECITLKFLQNSPLHKNILLSESE